jgi:hypothetical protein
MMEIRGWVSGDQPSGRLLTIPNGLVINHPLYNYIRDHSFVWDEISVPLTYDSDWRLAKDLVLGIVIKETAAMTSQADAEIERIGEKYYLPKKVVEPSAYITLTDNWITLDVRYVTDARSRRILRSRLNELILAAIEAEDRIIISSTTITVTSINGNPASGKEKKPRKSRIILFLQSCCLQSAGDCQISAYPLIVPRIPQYQEQQTWQNIKRWFPEDSLSALKKICMKSHRLSKGLGMVHRRTLPLLPNRWAAGLPSSTKSGASTVNGFTIFPWSS